MTLTLTFRDLKRFVPPGSPVVYASDTNGVTVVVDPDRPEISYRPRGEDEASQIPESMLLSDYPDAHKVLDVGLRS